MSTINTGLQQHGHYQLNNSGAGTSGANSAGRVSPSASSILASQQNNGFSDAVLLDLSPEAQKYLSSLGAQSVQPKTATAEHGIDSFVLSAQERLALSAVLEKYKDAPYTQDTFNAIQDDLEQAGISPDQLSARERVASFNSTAILVDALNGGNGSTPGSTPISDEALSKKAANYVQDIASQWKKLSQQTSDDNEGLSADAVSAVGGSEGAS